MQESNFRTHADRHMEPVLLRALADTPVVFLDGPRQSGKSTLVQTLAATRHPARYLTFDDATTLAAAHADPVGFLAGCDGPVVLDEIQRAPGMYLALKATVDRDRRPGRFLLTGSADALLLPRLADALVGRMERLTLWPLSQGERAGQREGFIDALFATGGIAQAPRHDDPETLSRRVLAGGFPEALARHDVQRRDAWFGSYVTTLLQRDVRDLAHVEGLADLPRLLALVAARNGRLHNAAEVARSLGMPLTTIRRYLTLLEATFLVHSIPAWSANLGKRLVRAPKLVVVDSGLAAHLQGLDIDRLRALPSLFGPQLEAFVAMELRRQLGWALTRARLYHWRSHDGLEVDLVVEDAAGRIAGVEVKASASVSSADFRSLRYLQGALGERFVRGVVLYGGADAVDFGPGLHAQPVASVWRTL